MAQELVVGGVRLYRCPCGRHWCVHNLGNRVVAVEFGNLREQEPAQRFPLDPNEDQGVMAPYGATEIQLTVRRLAVVDTTVARDPFMAVLTAMFGARAVSVPVVETGVITLVKGAR